MKLFRCDHAGADKDLVALQQKYPEREEQVYFARKHLRNALTRGECSVSEASRQSDGQKFRQYIQAILEITAPNVARVTDLMFK